MANRRKVHLDAVERRLTGPKRIALFGHRNVGKTTLLAMFYRQASTGQVPGVRLAAIDPPSAEYLAEKIAQIESGEPLAGTLAETELRLRLYHGPARFDLIVKDYQGEHVTLGSDEPIQQFFADCDAVLLCLDPEGSPHPAERRRRQQEVENLLERYIDSSKDGTTDRPVALLLTKFDRVMAQAGPGSDGVERLVEARYGMTRHALARHAPRGAIFAVSSYGRGAVDGRPPAELHPIGLEGPLGWLAEQLEAGDRDQLEWLWDLAPKDLPRLTRGVAAYERRYPNSDRAEEFRRRLAAARRKRARRTLVGFTAALGLIAAGLAGYDAWGYREAVAFEANNPATLVEARWNDLLTWHPTLPYFWPERGRQAQEKLAEWRVKAASDRVAAGTADPGLREQLAMIKEQRPALAPEIAKVERSHAEARHDTRWREVKAEAVASADRPDAIDLSLRAFLREFPETPRKAEVEALLQANRARVAERQSMLERRVIDDLIRSAALPNADYPDLIEQSRAFLKDHPESTHRAEVERLLAGYVKTLDDRQFDRARAFSRDFPTHYQARIEKYGDYLKSHEAGGIHTSEAREAKDRILREWDNDAYRVGYDLYTNHPDDVEGVAARLRDYLQQHPEGGHVAAAKDYLAWWDKVTVPGNYKVTLLRGEFDPEIGKWWSGGAPDLSVTIEVGGKIHGPSPTIVNSHKPVWRYTFAQPVVWKLGDPIAIKVVDNDWSDSTVVVLNSRPGDPLAIRLLTGTVKPTKGGPTSLVFASDFKMPVLPKPE
jgi:GTPase SAR1 family protein